jgi:hypothetical protein
MGSGLLLSAAEYQLLANQGLCTCGRILSAQKSNPKVEFHAGHARQCFRAHCELDSGYFGALRLACIARRLPSVTVSGSEYQGQGF